MVVRRSVVRSVGRVVRSLVVRRSFARGGWSLFGGAVGRRSVVRSVGSVGRLFGGAVVRPSFGRFLGLWGDCSSFGGAGRSFTGGSFGGGLFGRSVVGGSVVRWGGGASVVQWVGRWEGQRAVSRSSFVHLSFVSSCGGPLSRTRVVLCGSGS